MQLTAVVEDAAGDTLKDAAVGWSSTDTTRLVVDSVGTVTAKSLGHVYVRANVLNTSLEVVDSVSIDVMQAGVGSARSVPNVGAGAG
ncbi:MAG TPA: hypothetical protein VIJ16_10545 [Gemmatimonadaceae bacterium]